MAFINSMVFILLTHTYEINCVYELVNSHLQTQLTKQQYKSSACTGFATASDIEISLKMSNQWHDNEYVSPFITYGIYIYNQLGIETPECLELERKWFKLIQNSGVTIMVFRHICFGFIF